MGVALRVVIEFALEGKLHDPEVASGAPEIWLHRAAHQSHSCFRCRAHHDMGGDPRPPPPACGIQSRHAGPLPKKILQMRSRGTNRYGVRSDEIRGCWLVRWRTTAANIGHASARPAAKPRSKTLDRILSLVAAFIVVAIIIVARC